MEKAKSLLEEIDGVAVGEAFVEGDADAEIALFGGNDPTDDAWPGFCFERSRK